MADKRKLQGEIDRCIKKVAEGVALFEDVWQKVQTAPSLNQKEKFEADLKKEIKKLQRLRDQIKTWLASNDIKDKRQLTENRKIIEAQMERFKVVERETKTKAYSKEGLGAATKVDPREKDKEDAKEWVTVCIDTLQQQKDQFESEIEGIENKKKGNRLEKDRQERVDELKGLLEQHQEHIDCLELVLRGVDNDQIDLEQLKQIRDSVEYYLESHDSGDLSIYEDLHLDVLRLSSNSVGLTALANDDDSLSNSSDPPLINPSSPSPGLTNHSKDKPLEEEKKHGSKSASHADDVRRSSQQSSKASTAGLQLNCVSIPVTPTKRDSVSSSLESTTPDAILRTPPPVAYAQAVSGNQQNSRTNSTSSQPSSGSAGNSRPASQSAWTAAEGKSSEHGSSSTVPVTPTTVIAGVPLAPSAPLPSNGASSIVNGVVNGTSDSPPTAPASSLTGALSASSPQSTAGSLLPGDTSSAVVSPPLSAAFPGHSTSSLFPTQSASESKVVLNGPSSAIASLGKLQGHSDLSSLSAKLLTASQQQQQQQDLTAPASLSALAGTVFDSLPPNSLSSSDLSLLMQQQGQGQGAQLQSYVLHQQGQGLQQQAGQGSAGSQQQQQIPLQTTTIHLSPLLGVAPLGTQPLTKEQLYQMALLDTANMHLPYPSDSERLRYYLPRNPCPAPPYYPQSTPAQSDAVEFYQKLSVETLFFIFYYMEGTKAQYLAAKALKKQSWRFHTKYMMWFQRHEEPKMITEDYEQGTYVYFDYEKWCQRKKEGFTFEYRFLEDRDLN